MQNLVKFSWITTIVSHHGYNKIETFCPGQQGLPWSGILLRLQFHLLLLLIPSTSDFLLFLKQGNSCLQNSVFSVPSAWYTLSHDFPAPFSLMPIIQICSKVAFSKNPPLDSLSTLTLPVCLLSFVFFLAHGTAWSLSICYLFIHLLFVSSTRKSQEGNCIVSLGLCCIPRTVHGIS